jgi:hypothetical protein
MSTLVYLAVVVFVIGVILVASSFDKRLDTLESQGYQIRDEILNRIDKLENKK